MLLPRCFLPSVLAQGSQEAPGQQGHSERSCPLSPPSSPCWPPPHPLLTEAKNTLLSPRGCQPGPAQPSLAPSYPSRSSMPLGQLGSRVLQPAF